MVRTKIQSAYDLPAADTIYQHSCRTYFKTKMNILGSFISDQPEKKKMKTGRPVDQSCICCKPGLDCSLACGQCRGTGCSNSSICPNEDTD